MTTRSCGWNLRGLYAITDSGLGGSRGISYQVEQALQGHVGAIQFREKKGTRAQREKQASELLQRCRVAGVPLIVNDDVDLARAIDADGVHLGRDDADPLAARQLLGPFRIIGVSCYNEFSRAELAQHLGADYVAFGSFFPSTTKPGAVCAGTDLLQRAARELEIPVVAIGGITPQNGGALVRAGADMLAVIHGLFGQPDIRRTCSRFNQLFANSKDASR